MDSTHHLLGNEKDRREFCTSSFGQILNGDVVCLLNTLSRYENDPVAGRIFFFDFLSKYEKLWVKMDSTDDFWSLSESNSP